MKSPPEWSDDGLLRQMRIASGLNGVELKLSHRFLKCVFHDMQRVFDSHWPTFALSSTSPSVRGLGLSLDVKGRVGEVETERKDVVGTGQ